MRVDIIIYLNSVNNHIDHVVKILQDIRSVVVALKIKYCRFIIIAIN